MSAALKAHSKPLLLLALLCLILFGTNLGGYGLLDPDEPFYTLTAKEMLESGNWLVPTIFGEPQFEKPVFFYWLEILSFKLFGFAEWAARLSPCVAGFITIFLTYAWAQVLFKNKKVSFISALVLATAAEYVACSRVVLTDMVLCLFVTAAGLFFALGRAHFGFFFSALGFLTKGPLGLMIPLAAFAGKDRKLRFKAFWVFLLFGLPWYVYMAQKFGTDFLYQFFIHENVRRFFVAEHRGMDRVFFYPGGFLGGFFPWSVFLLPALFYGIREAIKNRTRSQKVFRYLSLAFWLPFIFFMMAKSKLLSYTFPLFPVLAILIGAWGVRFYRALGAGAHIKASLWPWAVAIWGIFPAVLTAAAFIYAKKNEPTVMAPIIAIGCVMIPLCVAALCLLWLRRLKIMVICLTLMITGFSILAFSWMMPAADVLFASNKWVEWYRADTKRSSEPLMLASKLYVRGVSYYTGEKNMAVVSENPERTFYTKHSVPIYSKKEEFLEIPKSDYPLYGFLRHKELVFLKKLLDKGFRIEMLHEDSVRVLIKLHREAL